MEPAKIKVDINFTVNMGNFQNFKIELGIEDWCRDGEKVGEATDRVYNFVERKMLEKVDSLKAEIEARQSFNS